MVVITYLYGAMTYLYGVMIYHIFCKLFKVYMHAAYDIRHEICDFYQVILCQVTPIQFPTKYTAIVLVIRFFPPRIKKNSFENQRSGVTNWTQVNHQT